MEKPKAPFTLPKQPVDGYVVGWFIVELSAGRVWVTHMEMTYHVSTPWSVYSPDRPGGKDIVDDWMMSENGHVRSRWCGWSTPIEKGDWKNCYATRAEALRRALDIMREKIARHDADRARLVADVDAWARELDALTTK